MQRFSDFSRLNDSGMPAPDALVTVYLTGTQILAQLYNSNDVTDVKSNPFTSGAANPANPTTAGLAQFYAANGRYDIRFSGGGIVNPWSLGDQLLYDPDDLGANLWINPTLSPFNATGDGVTDDSAAIQAALDASKALLGLPIWFPPGVFRVTTQLDYLTAVDFVDGPTIWGSGRYATIFDNQVAGGALFNVAQTASGKFLRGGEFKDFSIITTTNPANSVGINLNAIYQCRLENVLVDGLSSSGITITVALGDLDGSGALIFERIWVDSCGGYGVNVVTTGGAIEFSSLQCRSSVFQNNTLGGFRYRGLNATFETCAFVLNSPVGSGGVGGLQLAQTTGINRMIVIRSCDFENNGVCHLDIQGATHGVVDQCEFLHSNPVVAGWPITTGIKIGGSGLAGAAVINLRVSKAFVRNTTAGYVQYLLGADSQQTEIDGTRWDVWNDALPQTRFSIDVAATFTRILNEDGYDWPFPAHAKTTNVAAGGSYTPDASQYLIHRVVMTSAGAYTINNPTVPGGAFGRMLVLDLVNASGGAVVVSFGAGYFYNGFANPTNGNHKASWFYHDNNSPWMQIGSWNA